VIRVAGLAQSELSLLRDVIARRRPELLVIVERIGPTPEELGQTDPSAFAKWDALREVGRPWLTGKEAAGAGMH